MLPYTSRLMILSWLPSLVTLLPRSMWESAAYIVISGTLLIDCSCACSAPRSEARGRPDALLSYASLMWFHIHAWNQVSVAAPWTLDRLEWVWTISRRPCIMAIRCVQIDLHTNPELKERINALSVGIVADKSDQVSSYCFGQHELITSKY